MHFKVYLHRSQNPLPGTLLAFFKKLSALGDLVNYHLNAQTAGSNILDLFAMSLHCHIHMSAVGDMN